MLPDVALLQIFDFCGDEERIEAWHTLVHVCRNWRNVVFGSPRRLNLRLHCKARTPVRETLYVWPPLPIVIRVSGYEMWAEDNILAALEHNDRICHLDLLNLPSSKSEKVLAAMQRPFPALTHLALKFNDETVPVDPASFLGESAPNLQSLVLECISFTGLTGVPNLLLSATHLVHLHLWRIPFSGYLSSEAIATCLPTLTRLESLHIGFELPRNTPEHWQSSIRPRILPPPPTRVLLPVLTVLEFQGSVIYLEDFVARIDAPLLNYLNIAFFRELVYHSPQLTQFISRTPMSKTHDEARVVFSNRDIWVKLPQTSDGKPHVGITCITSSWRLLSLAHVCTVTFLQALLPAVERLYILEDGCWDWQGNIEDIGWPELFSLFTAVKELYISSEFMPCIASTLVILTELLPALQTLFLEEPLLSGPDQEVIGQFLSLQQLCSHPIAVSRWER